MKRYTASLLIVTALLLGGFGGFNMLVDPYDIVGGPRIDGFNAAKTRTREDGGRITASHLIINGGMGSAVFGSSRTVDGFPEISDAWPGGITNVGMRGSNAFELSRALSWAGHDPQFRCAVIGLDLDELGDHGKAKATYWVTPLPDGDRLLGLARAALSPYTFARSIQTIGDNMAGEAPSRPWKAEYAPGEQRERFTRSTSGDFGFAHTYRFDPERLDYLAHALDRLTEQGVQVVGFIHPVHAYREEAFIRAGRLDDVFQLRRDLAEVFARYADRQPAAACAPGGAAALWDFAGYQDFATRPIPSVEQTEPNPHFYEPAHYLPHVGEAMLTRMAGGEGEGVFAPARFGLRLTPETAAASEADILARREAWLSRPDVAELTARIDALEAENRRYDPETRLYLNRDDWRELTRDLARIPARAPELSRE